LHLVSQLEGGYYGVMVLFDHGVKEDNTASGLLSIAS
jgi:hypothetical protein